MRRNRRKLQTRRIHLEGKVWTYRVSDEWVVIRDPDGKTTPVPRWNEYRSIPNCIGWDNDYPTPQIVKNYIWKRLRPGMLLDHPSDTDHAKEMVLNLFLGAQKEMHVAVWGKDGKRRYLRK